MAENKEGQEKTEDASQKKLDEARLRGQVSKSMDVTTSAVLLFGGMGLFLIFNLSSGQYQSFMAYILRNSSTLEVTFQSIIGYYPGLVMFLATVLFPLLFLIFFVVLGIEISQTGLKIATKKYTELEDLKKIFKIGAGLKRIFFSSRSIFELGKSIAKIAFIATIVYLIISARIDEIVSLAEKPFTEIGSFMFDISFDIILYVGLSYLIIAGSDYFYQKYKFLQDLKMTKQEVKEEHKQMEGDPKVKGRIRSLMRSRIRKLMIQNVAKADVVITNPTHYAVAIMYKAGDMNAPILIAKGADYLAYQIREKAKENDIPIVEEAPLARAIYFNVDVDKEIPENLFKAVAKVLAYVYSLKEKV